MSIGEIAAIALILLAGGWTAYRMLRGYPSPKPVEIQCPVCGYYCIGQGGHGCIDKPSIVKAAEQVRGGA